MHESKSKRSVNRERYQPGGAKATFDRARTTAFRTRRISRPVALDARSRRTLRLQIAFLAVGLATSSAWAADGMLDPSFGTSASGRTIVFFDQGDGNADVATTVHVDPTSGSILLGGTVSHTDPDFSPFGIAKLRADGSPIESFGNLGVGRMTSGGSGTVLEPLAMHLDALGAPKLAGDSRPIAAGISRLFGAETGSDGFDASIIEQGLPLAGGGTAEAFVQDATVDATGRRLVCGVTDLSGDSVAFVARLTADESLDPTFGVGGSGWASTWIIDPALGATWCEAVEVDRDGRILLLLRGLSYSTLQAFGGVERRVSSGATIDPLFGGGGQVIINVRPDAEAEILTDLAVSDYGEIFVVGFAQGPVTSSRAAILRLLSADGSSVTPSEFYVLPGSSHTYTRFELTRAAFDPAGRLVAGGTFVEGSAPLEHRMVVVRFSSPFVFDAAFGSGGISYVSFTGIPGFTRERADLEDMVVAPDGRIVIAGRALFDSVGDNYDFAVARLDNAAMFLDGFETGDASRWSSSTP